MTALLRDTAEPVAPASLSPLIGPLFRGIVGSNHFRLRDDAIFILRESVAVEQVLLQGLRAVQIDVVLLKDILEQLGPLREAVEQAQDV